MLQQVALQALWVNWLLILMLGDQWKMCKEIHPTPFMFYRKAVTFGFSIVNFLTTGKYHFNVVDLETGDDLFCA